MNKLSNIPRKIVVAEIILKSQAKMTLKCLSAQAVKRHHVSYQGQVPQSLENFIELHGP